MTLASASRWLRRRLAERRETGFALVLFVVLLAVNVLLNPARFAPTALGTTIGLAAPLIAASMSRSGRSWGWSTR